MSIELEVRLRNSPPDPTSFVSDVCATWLLSKNAALRVVSRGSLDGLSFESTDGSRVTVDTYTSIVSEGEEGGRWAILAVATRGDESLALLATAAGSLAASLGEAVLDDAGMFSEQRWIRPELLINWPAQSSVAPDGSASVAPEAGAPSSAPRVNAGIGQTPEGDGGDGKDGQ